MNIAVIGCGYVGLVSGTCLAALGHKVTAVDVDAARVKSLREGIVPIYEPGLSELIKKQVAEDRLFFDTDTAKATREASTIFIAVGTPPAKDGGYDFSYLFAAAENIAKAADAPKTVVIKSTVTPGTGSKLAALVDKLSSHKIEVVNNPEFLREGTAVQDFMQPDRIVFGATSDDGHAVLREIYQPLIDRGYAIYAMSRESAELTKFAANAMLATRISFINEISQLAQAIGADIESVRLGIGTDKRIGPAFLKAGVGYGGSCFPKDVQALVHQMKSIGIDPLLLSGIEAVNTRQKQFFAKRILDTLKDIPNPHVAVWGLAFKSDTDDTRDAAAFVVIDALLAAGATVSAYDPQAIDNAKKILGTKSGKLTYCADVDECTKNAHAVALLTDWPEFISQDFTRVAKLMKGTHLFDGRNCLASGKVTAAGLHYHAVGRPPLKPGQGKQGTMGSVSAGT
ncbi:MAG TPA: UDP-glucose/GDP-mannose dehydrogenase family protein [Phycisphaerae bacterium]|nr:UDP-glucose/GDP-mannose dehydrogenase family protein [Phycisphaerae bacterium]